MKTFRFPGESTGPPSGSIGPHLEDQLGALLHNSKLTLRVEEISSDIIAFFDTFDWRLYNKSLALTRQSFVYTLRQLIDGSSKESLELAELPAFADDLPESTFKELLMGITAPRALQQLSEVNVKTQTARVLNKEQKTVLFLIYSGMSAKAVPGQNTPTQSLTSQSAFLALQPVRGYSKPAQMVEAALTQAGYIESNWQDFYLSALSSCSVEPGSYSSKIPIQLEPDLRADKAASQILLQLLAVIRANEAGIRADIDIEFLHDFRVAVRKTRSALGQIRNIFPAEITEQFKQDFSSLGSVTNQLRDLDVYLLAEDSYKALLPAEKQADIEPLFDYMRTQRTQALTQVVDYLDSKEYARILDNWERFLHGVSTPGKGKFQDISEPVDAANAALPIIELARMRIYSRYRRVIKDGNILLEQPNNEQMHALRIDCKKLRYLIEFFESLFPREHVDALISQLKKLQDNLGEFNDLSVQQAYLIDIANHLPIRRVKTRDALVATGILVNNLHLHQEVVRENFAEIFSIFASQQNQSLFKSIFADKKSSKPPVRMEDGA